MLRWLALVMHGGSLPAGHGIADELTSYGLTGDLRTAFLEPWLRGITLDPALGADAGAVRAYVKAFAHGPAALPAGGMAAIPKQLAAKLAPGSVHYRQPVQAVSATSVTRSDGRVILASHVVVATGPQQRQLGHDSAKSGYANTNR